MVTIWPRASEEEVMETGQEEAGEPEYVPNIVRISEQLLQEKANAANEMYEVGKKCYWKSTTVFILKCT